MNLPEVLLGLLTSSSSVIHWQVPGTVTHRAESNLAAMEKY